MARRYLFPVPAKPLRSLLDAKAQTGEPFTEDEAALDVMLAMDRDDLRTHRYLSKRWGWSDSKAYRQMGGLTATADEWRTFYADAVKHSETEVKHSETEIKQNGTAKPAPETEVKHSETEVEQYRSDPDNRSQKISNTITSGNPTTDGIPYSEIVEDLNEQAGTRYRHTTKKTRTLIRARWADGYRAEDFRAVHLRQVQAWGDTSMAQYLRPETLYSPKFESYRNSPAPTKNETERADHNRSNPVASFHNAANAALSALRARS